MMQTVTIYPHITKVESSPATLERLPRVRVSQIVGDHFRHRWSAEQILSTYPHLTMAEIYAALLYYHDHKSEIDEELAKEWNEYLNSRSAAAEPQVVARLRATGSR